MKNFYSKTYKFGRLTVSIFSNEIVFIFIGRRKVYVHKIHPDFNSFKKKLAFSVPAAALILTLSVIFSPGQQEELRLDDDALKNSLLKSEKTDYSSPDKNVPLEIRTHVVKKGENLSAIAKKYGVSIDTICGSNNLTSYDFINIGKKLKIPNKDGILMNMSTGTSVVSIAKKYRVSLKKIIDENDIKNPDFIAVNTELFIPDAKPQNIIRGFLWPTFSKRITCGYGWRRNPFNHSYREFHQGLDIGARYEWIRSSKYGKVTYSGWLRGYGKTVIIAHPGGWKTLYAHLSRIIVQRGQYVKQGQYIGKSGNTGRSTGPHLHFEIMKQGRHQNPYRYLVSK